VLAQPYLREQLAIMGLESWAESAADLGKQHETDLKKYGEVTKKLKISVE
jgi:hypothetical protein